MELLSIGDAIRLYLQDSSVYLDSSAYLDSRQGAAFYWQVSSYYIYEPAAHISTTAGGPFPMDEKST